MSLQESRNWIVFLTKQTAETFICNGLLWNNPKYRTLKIPLPNPKTPQESKNNGKDKKLWINQREADWGEGTHTYCQPSLQGQLFWRRYSDYRGYKKTQDTHLGKADDRQSRDDPGTISKSLWAFRGEGGKRHQKQPSFDEKCFTKFSPRNKPLG